MKIKFLYLSLLIAVSGCVAPVQVKNRQTTVVPTSVSTDACAVGCPTGGSEQTLYREAYVLNNNPQQKMANWVAYRITKSSQASGKPRNWKQDPDLPAANTLAPAAYKGANAALAIDRGHQAPLASLAGNSDWAALNYLSNITPQKAALNQGAWARLEDKERALANRPDVEAVYSITGPIFDKTTPTLPNAPKVHLPRAYWKVIFTAPDLQKGSYAAFLIDQNAPRNADYCEYLVTVRDIEELTQPPLNIWSVLPVAVARDIKLLKGRLANELGCDG